MKRAIAAITAIAVIGVIIIFLVFRGEVYSPDLIVVNDAVQAAMESGCATESVMMLGDSLTQAFADMDAARAGRDDTLRVSLYLIVIGLALSGILLCIYIERGIFIPFRKLQQFAHRIAAGSLDIPLEMDRHNLFGAFTEGFDLMRVELRRARENEYRANLSKKELVASLSHDIKTPVASIMSAMDIMMVTATCEKEKQRIASINVKLEQINALVTNMFHATLEELHALQVAPKEMQSTELVDFIRNADYENRTIPFSIPDCIILADSLRLQQVLDNIIVNSYKYANTDILVDARIEGGYLIIAVQDFGAGVPEEEIPLIINKFYRGKNAENSNGYGLGLYISNYFMGEMKGKLLCKNRDEGFTVTLMLRLAVPD